MPVTTKIIGGLAQLARALALQARGHRFDSDILHHAVLVQQKFFDMLEIRNYNIKSNIY